MAKKAKKATTRPRKVILPRKMSSLIKLALHDIRRVEADAKYTINMTDWHRPRELVCRFNTDTGDEDKIITRHQTCSVCFAGAVMAMSLKIAADKDADPVDFGDNSDQLGALDDLRMGDVSSAADALGLPGTIADYGDGETYVGGKYINYGKYDTPIPDYDRDDPEPFHRAMTKLQVRLAKAGL